MSQPVASARPTQASNRRWMGMMFWLVLAGVAVLLLVSGYGALVNADRANLQLAVLGGLSGFGATALGAVAAIALRDISARTQDTMLGFAAGMMLAASSFSLILPGIEAARELSGNPMLAAGIVVLGLGLGVALMIGLDRFVLTNMPRAVGAGRKSSASTVWLFVWRLPCTTCGSMASASVSPMAICRSVCR